MEAARICSKESIDFCFFSVHAAQCGGGNVASCPCLRCWAASFISEMQKTQRSRAVFRADCEEVQGLKGSQLVDMTLKQRPR